MTCAPVIQKTLFSMGTGAASAETARTPRRASSAASAALPPEQLLHTALAAYGLDLPKLRTLAAMGADLAGAFPDGERPPEIAMLCAAFAALLRPTRREQIKSPDDLAALLMVEMAHLDQEELRTVCLDTKNRVQAIETIYRGSLNSSLVRVGEIFRPALRHNSAALIVVHNHPSGDPTPSPEDVAVTRQIVAAGKLLDVDVLDHLVISQGRYVSLRQRGLGFEQ